MTDPFTQALNDAVLKYGGTIAIVITTLTHLRAIVPNSNAADGLILFIDRVWNVIAGNYGHAANANPLKTSKK